MSEAEFLSLTSVTITVVFLADIIFESETKRTFLFLLPIAVLVNFCNIIFVLRSCFKGRRNEKSSMK